MRSSVILLTLILCAPCGMAQKYNFNIGGGPGFPKGDTSRFAGIGPNFEVGAGVNLFRFLGIQAEYMYDGLPVKDDVQRRITVTDAHASLNSFTGNVILRSTNDGKLGFYFIGGGGWYRRSWKITAPEGTGVIVCDPAWVWLGTVACINNVVPEDEILASGHTDGSGWNVGGGVTLRIGEGSAKFYTEVRYHRASTDPFDTEVLPLSFGIRW